MIYDRQKLKDIIERLETIKEYDYITYPDEDTEKVGQILAALEEQVKVWEEMQNNNYSY